MAIPVRTTCSMIELQELNGKLAFWVGFAACSNDGRQCGHACFCLSCTAPNHLPTYVWTKTHSGASTVMERLLFTRWLTTVLFDYSNVVFSLSGVFGHSLPHPGKSLPGSKQYTQTKKQWPQSCKICLQFDA